MVKWIDFPFVRGADGTQLLKIDETKAVQKYIYYVLKNIKITNSDKYERHFKYLKQMEVPLPKSLDVQRNIVAACEAVDSEYERIRMSIGEYHNSIEQLFDDTEIVSLYDGVLQALKVFAVYSDIRVDCARLTEENYVGVDNMLQNKEGKTISAYVPTSGTATEYIAGDILLSNIRPYLKKIWFADNNGGCSGDVLAVRLTGDKVVPEYVYDCLSQDKFFEYEMRYKKGIKMPRGEKSKIMDYQIPIPSFEIQHELVNKALEIEVLITAAKSKLVELDIKKQSILDECLR